MHKNDVDRIVSVLIKEGWNGKTHKDFEIKLGEMKLGEKYSYDQIERIRIRYLYINRKDSEEEM